MLRVNHLLGEQSARRSSYNLIPHRQLSCHLAYFPTETHLGQHFSSDKCLKNSTCYNIGVVIH